jgi:hypothetical protein
MIMTKPSTIGSSRNFKFNSASTPNLLNPSSSSLVVPDVYVVPPEEEHHINPPYCLHDSHESLSTIEDEPNDAAPPLRRIANRAKTNRNIDTLKEEIEDSDIVEVVRVRKNRQSHVYEQDQAQPSFPSTIKSRASRAMRSIRIVSKGSIRSKLGNGSGRASPRPGEQHGGLELAPPLEEPTSRHTRHRSATISQMFSAPRNKSKLDLDNPSAEGSDIPNKDTSLRGFYKKRVSSDSARLPSHSHPSTEKENRRLFSLSSLDIHKMFSKSSESQPRVTSPTLYRSSTESSNHSSDVPKTPRDRVADECPENSSKPSAVTDDDDVSVEMRLDSFHFDSLSFDAENFDISR